jgi:hypothetical protein
MPWLWFPAEPETWADVPVEVNSPLMEKAMNVLDRFRHNGHARAIYEARMNEERQRIASEAALRIAEAEAASETEARQAAEQNAVLEAEARRASERLREEVDKDCERLRAMLLAAGIDPDAKG